MPKFTITYDRPADPDHPVAKYREASAVTIAVTAESLKGCLSGTLRITAFNGERQIFVHTTSGHYFNWCVVILAPDTTPRVIQGPEYQSETSIEQAFDAIAAVEGPWWPPTLAKIKELMSNN